MKRYNPKEKRKGSSILLWGEWLFPTFWALAQLAKTKFILLLKIFKCTTNLIPLFKSILYYIKY